MSGSRAGSFDDAHGGLTPARYYDSIEADPEMEVQETKYGCGPACGVRMLRDFGVEGVTQSEIGDAAGLTDAGEFEGAPKGVTANRLAEALNRYSDRIEGAPVFEGGPIDLGRIKPRVAARDPRFYASILSGGGGWAHRAPIFWQSGHVVMLERFDAERGMMSVLDPAGIDDGAGGRTGLRATIPLEEFAAQWGAGGYNWICAKGGWP